jgi:hypothetical protein
MRRALWLALFVAICPASHPARAAIGETPIAKTASDQLAKALPGYEITIADPLTIKIHAANRPADDTFLLNLDRVAAYCAHSPGDCGHAISQFVARIVPVIQAQNSKLAPTQAALRAVVRPAAYAAQLTALMAKSGGLVSEPVAGDVVMLCYFDMPTAMRPTTKSDLASLNLSPEQALDLCRQNTRAALPPLPKTPPRSAKPTEGAIGVLNGDPYESSYLSLHDAWAPMAGMLGGRMLVAAPDAAVVFYGEDGGPVSVDALSTIARKAYSKAERPISRGVYRWTPRGWEVAAP